MFMKSGRHVDLHFGGKKGVPFSDDLPGCVPCPSVLMSPKKSRFYAEARRGLNPDETES